jgi:D-sedoheptulose 7-phosphate isomerase
MPYREFFQQYTNTLAACLQGVAVTDAAEHPLDAMMTLDGLTARLRQLRASDGKVMLIGNGGSAAMASHIAFDFWKRAKINATAFNDPILLTASVNDFGYERMFAEPVRMFAKRGDVLFAISSSGKSPNIINAAWEGRKIGCEVVTLSAFGADNPLRKVGNVNIYLNNTEYGHAELGHETILHSLADYILSVEKA